VGSVRRRGGVVRVGLEDAEVVLLANLVSQVKQMLGGDTLTPEDPVEALLTMPSGPVEAPQDPVLARLLPNAYRNDDGASEEFRRLMDGELRAQKRAALQRVVDDLAGGGTRNRGALRLELGDDAAQLWLYALNDVRLALGTALDVAEDMDEVRASLESDDPRYLQLGVYDWVTWLQDAIVRAVS
jgi:hypothetical protein